MSVKKAKFSGLRTPLNSGRSMKSFPAYPFAEISGGTTVEYTEGGITWRHHELRSSGSLTVVKSGYVETLMLMGGGGGGNSGEPAYRGGGGGAGGQFVKIWPFLESQTITATIGNGGNAGSGRGQAGRGGTTTATIQGFGNTPGSPISCGGGGGGGGQNVGGGSAGSGANGGSAGGAGGRGSDPGVPSQPGVSTLSNFILRRDNGQRYGVAGIGQGTGNTGNGGPQGGAAAGSAGVLLIRYPIIVL